MIQEPFPLPKEVLVAWDAMQGLIARKDQASAFHALPVNFLRKESPQIVPLALLDHFLRIQAQHLVVFVLWEQYRFLLSQVVVSLCHSNVRIIISWLISELLCRSVPSRDYGRK